MFLLLCDCHLSCLRTLRRRIKFDDGHNCLPRVAASGMPLAWPRRPWWRSTAHDHLWAERHAGGTLCDQGQDGPRTDEDPWSPVADDSQAPRQKREGATSTGGRLGPSRGAREGRVNAIAGSSRARDSGPCDVWPGHDLRPADYARPEINYASIPIRRDGWGPASITADSSH